MRRSPCGRDTNGQKRAVVDNNACGTQTSETRKKHVREHGPCVSLSSVGATATPAVTNVLNRLSGHKTVYFGNDNTHHAKTATEFQLGQGRLDPRGELAADNATVGQLVTNDEVRSTQANCQRAVGDTS